MIRIWQRYIELGTMRRGPLIVAVVAALGVVSAGAVGGVDVVTVLDEGVINWTVGKVTAVGQATVNEAPMGQEQGSEEAVAAATEAARANLLAVLKNVRIDANTVVGNFSEKRGAIIAELKHLVEETAERKQEALPGGGVRVTLEIGLYGAIEQLLLPADVKQLTTIRPLKRQGGASGANLGKKRTGSTAGRPAFSGLNVDARRIKVQPALMPIIRDERGEEVYSAAFVSREFAVQNGVVQYSRDPDAAAVKKRVGAKPLIIRALDTVGGKHSQLIVSNADAARVRGAYENLSLLKECRVSVIVD